MSTKKIASWALLILLASCVTPYDADVKSAADAVVVQGFISNNPGPYRVQVVRPADYARGGFSIGINNAVVYITDDKGVRENLVRTEASGEYITQNLRGEIGRTYQIHLEIAGRKYESEPELMRQPGKIDRIYHESFREINPTTNEERQGGWKVFIDTKDPAQLGDYYRWNVIHYKRISSCGVSYTANRDPQYQLQCCTTCWDIGRCLGPECLVIANDALFNGQSITRQEVTTVPVECRDRYYMEVEQQALSREAYTYLKTVKRLLNNTGGVFDVAPSTVQGNLTCTTDPNQLVLGYFSAVGLSSVGYEVDRTNAEYSNCPEPLPSPPGPSPCVPCEESLTQTKIAPKYWKF